ncbi:MAG: AIR synthase [Clostridiales bacterium]|jgi:hydrogenase expression/formation protein HypE|nr:AIR synthase [Clostridiales bacterium]
MRTGKLNSEELKDAVLSRIEHRRDEVITGAALGEDCASFRSDGLILISGDPVTGETSKIGELAIRVAANDIWAGGGEPFLVMLTIIAPVTYTPEDIKKIMTDAEAEAKAQNIEIAGGHTEFSDAVNRVIVCCTALGKAAKHFKVKSASVGESIVVTKYIGLEGTALLAEAFAERLENSLGKDAVEEALSLAKLTDVSAESKIARRCGITSMHDITEGGIYGAVSELCEGAGVGARLYTDKIPVLPVTKAVCAELGADPYRLISSGSMLITTKDPGALIEALSKAGIKASVVGEITEGKPTAIDGGNEITLDVRADELFRLTQTAEKTRQRSVTS